MLTRQYPLIHDGEADRHGRRGNDHIADIDPLLDRQPQVKAEPFGDGRRLRHHLRGECPGRRELADLGEGATGESADRIERQVAPRLHPQMRADVSEHP